MKVVDKILLNDRFDQWSRVKIKPNCLLTTSNS